MSSTSASRVLNTHRILAPYQTNILIVGGDTDTLDKLETTATSQMGIQAGSRVYKLTPYNMPPATFEVKHWEKVGQQWQWQDVTKQIHPRQVVDAIIATKQPSINLPEETRFYTVELLGNGNSTLPMERVINDFNYSYGPDSGPSDTSHPITNLVFKPSPIFQVKSHVVGGPVEFPAVIDTSISDADFTAACWSALGITDPTSLGSTGAGVTVVIVDSVLDAYKELKSDSPTRPLVDFLITLGLPGKLDVDGKPQPKDLTLYKDESFSKSGIKPTGELDLNPPSKVASRQRTVNQAIPYHGLMIAGLIRKIAPDATIVLVEAFNSEGEGISKYLAATLDYFRSLNLPGSGDALTVDPKKLVFNLSLGVSNSGPDTIDDEVLFRSCKAICDTGAVIAAAAGNEGYYLLSYNPQEPAAYGYFNYDTTLLRQVIAVAGSGFEAKEYVMFSNQGNLGAPAGYMLLDTAIGDKDPTLGTRYLYWAGTSFATPYVAASAALLLAKKYSVSNQDVTPEDVKKLLLLGAERSDQPFQAPILNLAKSVSLI